MKEHKWILLAEDNAIDADLALRTMGVNEAKVEVVLASDGVEALDCLYRRGAYEARDSGDPAVVLLDLKMPKVDGLEVLRQIKADLRLKQIPVVIFSSSREEADLAQCYQLGANAYVVKPVAFREYRDVLQQVRRFWTTINESPSGDPVGNGARTPQLITAA
jgi:CheY-like chemotaxis protein